MPPLWSALVPLACALASPAPPGPRGDDPRERRQLVFALQASSSGPDIPMLMAERRLQEHRDGGERRLRTKNSHPISLENYQNVQYQLRINIGTPCVGGGGVEQGQVFDVVPDTGSSDLWVPAINCTSCDVKNTRFNLRNSCSAEEVGNRVTFKYGDGTVCNGGTFFDWVQIGDLQVERQLLVQVDSVETDTNMQSDGILGLAHHSEADPKKKGRGVTFIETLFKEHVHLPQMFSFYMTGFSGSERGSSLIFGDPDLATHSKETAFRYGKSYWMSSTKLWLTSVWSIGWSHTGVQVEFPDRGTLGAAALVDSGSSLIVLQPDIYDRLLEELQVHLGPCHTMHQHQIMACACPADNDLSAAPELVINIIDDQDQQFALCMSPDEYILESIEKDGSSVCIPALQRGSFGQPVPLIFGMTFMRSFYTNFDVKNHRIGFARSDLSPLDALAMCRVEENPLRRVLWITAVLVALFSILLSLSICACG